MDFENNHPPLYFIFLPQILDRSAKKTMNGEALSSRPFVVFIPYMWFKNVAYLKCKKQQLLSI
jgi:hypothetical protein